MITYIYGPQGCGKTNNKERFAKHYNCVVYEEAEFFDGKTRQLNDVVILGNDNPMDEFTCKILNINCVSFDDAMKASVL